MADEEEENALRKILDDKSDDELVAQSERLREQLRKLNERRTADRKTTEAMTKARSHPHAWGTRGDAEGG